MKNVRKVPSLIWQRLPRIIVSAVVLSLLLLSIQGAIQVKKNTDATRENTQAAKDNTEATQQLVRDLASAVDILETDSERKLSIIICMLQVPIVDRTTDLLASCRRDAGDTVVSSPTQSRPQSSAPTPTTSRPTVGQAPQSPTPPEEQTPPPDNDGIILHPCVPFTGICTQPTHIPSPF